MRILLFIFAIHGFNIWGYAQTQTMLFEKSWGEPIDVGIWYADELPNGDFILMGGKRFFNQGATQNYACRMDAKGNIIWEQDWGNPGQRDGIGKVLRLDDGTYMAVGGGYSGMGGISDATLTNIDPDGNILFYNYYNFGYNDAATDIFETVDGSFVLSGVGGGLGNYYPIYMKVDRSGNELWRRSQTSLPDYGQFYISEFPDHSFISVGVTDGNRNTYITKYDSFGALQWIRYPFGQSDSIGNRAQVLRTNADGTFSVYYSVFYPVGSPKESVLGIYAVYSVNGDELLRKEYTTLLITMRYDQADSTFSGIENGITWYTFDADSNLHKQVSLSESAPHLKDLMYVIKTKDGGYFGVGQQHWDYNTPRNFYIVKFAPDGRYQPEPFLETINVYPNPSADGNFTLSFDLLTDETVQIRVLSCDGRLVYTDEIYCPANSHTELLVRLNSETTGAGLYILETKTSGEFRRQKLVAMREN